MKERVFRYGENNRGFGTLSLPKRPENAPIIVMLNAGLLHRVEPFRLNVLASRQLAELGYICARVDLSGKGDTPVRKGLINRESVSLDWRYMKEALERQFGSRNFIIFGLCSGADNGIKLAAEDPAIKGLVLLDAISKKDPGFARRRLIRKLSNINNFKDLPTKLYNLLRRKYSSVNTTIMPTISLRDEPTDIDLQECFSGLLTREGRVLAVFTNHAVTHYNQQGQFCRALSIPGIENICEEVFWPTADHLYRVNIHRERLIKKVCKWADHNRPVFLST